MPKKSAMLANLEAQIERKYQAMFYQKMRILLQMAQDAAMIAAHDVLKMGRGRAVEYAEAYRRQINDMSELVTQDAKGDRDFEYAKAKIDGQLKQICGENFEPWEVRYGDNGDS